MRIKFIKIEEGKVKAANKELKRKFLAKKGHETEGFKGTYEYAAKKQVAKGKDKSTQAGVEAGKVAVGRAALGSAGTGALRGSNRRARQLAHKERLAKQNSSTEILGNKIVESFGNLLNEYRGKHSGFKKGEAPVRGSEEAKTVANRTRFERAAAEAGSKNPNLAKSRLRMAATGKYPDGAPASFEDKQQMGRIVARTGKVAKRAGGKPVSREGAGVRSREENKKR